MRYNDQVYKITTNGLVSTNFASTIQSSTSDLQYLVAANVLYRYAAG